MIPNSSLLHYYLSKDNILISFRQRVVGIESLIFLSEQLLILRPTIELVFRQHNLESDITYISDFYSNIVGNSFGLRIPVYRGIARYSLNYEQVKFGNILELRIIVTQYFQLSIWKFISPFSINYIYIC